MTVYELIRALVNFPSAMPVFIHGDARAWEDASKRMQAATTDEDGDQAERDLNAADDAPPAETHEAWEGDGRVVIS